MLITEEEFELWISKIPESELRRYDPGFFATLFIVDKALNGRDKNADRKYRI